MISPVAGTPEVLSRYKQEMFSRIDFNLLSSILVEGSFGRDDACRWSDLDVDFITKEPWDIEQITTFSQKELSVRRNLAGELGYPNLDRHWCTVFTETEQELYDRSFAVRVGVPRCLGESLSLHGQPMGEIKQAPHSDIVVSLREFELHAQNNKDRTDQEDGISARKYIRRIFREMFYNLNGERITKTNQVDEAIKRFGGDEKVLEASHHYIDFLCLNGASPNGNQAYDLSHRLLFTMQKVRWELVSGLDARDLINWQTEVRRRHGFFPGKIKELVRETDLFLGNSSPEMVEWLNYVPHMGGDEVNGFHSYHSDWMRRKADAVLC